MFYSPIVACCYFPWLCEQKFGSSCLVTTPWSILVVLYSGYSQQCPSFVLLPLFLSPVRFYLGFAIKIKWEIFPLAHLPGVGDGEVSACLGEVEKLMKGFLCLPGSWDSPGSYKNQLGSREMFLALPSNSFSPWAVHRSIRKKRIFLQVADPLRQNQAEGGLLPQQEPEGPPELPSRALEVSQGFQECHNLLCQALPTLLGWEGNGSSILGRDVG